MYCVWRDECEIFGYCEKYEAYNVKLKESDMPMLTEYFPNCSYENK